jgi:hypothetical protein
MRTPSSQRTLQDVVWPVAGTGAAVAVLYLLHMVTATTLVLLSVLMIRGVVEVLRRSVVKGCGAALLDVMADNVIGLIVAMAILSFVDGAQSRARDPLGHGGSIILAVVAVAAVAIRALEALFPALSARRERSGTCGHGTDVVPPSEEADASSEQPSRR